MTASFIALRRLPGARSRAERELRRALEYFGQQGPLGGSVAMTASKLASFSTVACCAALLAGCAAPSAPPTPRERTLYAFNNTAQKYGLPRPPAQDGENPRGTLTLITGKAGVLLFGRTTAGGNATKC